MTVLKPLLPQNLQQWVNLRQKKILLARSQQKRILFHAASGEIEYVKSIIREFKILKPEFEIIVSYSSPSAEKLFFNIQDFVAEFVPLPWDKPKNVADFLIRINPALIVFSRTDFWPELIHQASKKTIPMIAVSLSPRFSFYQNIWLKFNLSKMSALTAVNSSASQKLTQFVNTQVTTLADTRFDQVMHRLNSPSKFEIKTEQKIIVFGSTWPEDEVVLFDVIAPLVKLNYKIIFSPHDVSSERIHQLKKILQNFKIVLFSQINSPHNFDSDIIILDQIGYLADLYRYSCVAFVGGSFKSKVHSVMEPLCANNYVIVGPFYTNNPEAIDFKNKGFVFTVNTASELLSVLNGLMQAPHINDLQKQIQSQLGSTKKTIEIILAQLSLTS